MTTQFQKWTERVTDGTGDLFWISEGMLVGKDTRPYQVEQYFRLSIFNELNDEFDLNQEFIDKRGWKLAYRLARVAKKYGKSHLCRVPQ